jgi:hypothetical protein
MSSDPNPKFPIINRIGKTSGNFLTQLVIAAVVYFVIQAATGIRLFQAIIETNERVQEIAHQSDTNTRIIASIKSQYTVEDEHGAGIMVGINNLISNHHGKIYVGNQDISVGDLIEVTNITSTLRPKITVMITETFDREDPNTKCDVYISKHAGQLLDINLAKGIFNLKYKRVE